VVERRVRTCPGTDGGAVLVGHEDIVAVLETVGIRTIFYAFLTFFEFLEQAEVAWNWQIFWRGKGRGEESRLYQSSVKEKKKGCKSQIHTLCHRSGRNETCVIGANVCFSLYSFILQW
jgi:hypothetical protein